MTAGSVRNFMILAESFWACTLITACAQGPFGLSPNTGGGSAPNTTSSVPLLNNKNQQAALGILQADCSGCHASGAGPGGVYSLDDVNHMVSSGLIVPGQPSQSLLYLTVSGGSMPPTGALPKSSQQILQAWISGSVN